MSEPHVGDVGTVFQVQVRDGVLPADLSGAISLSMMFVSAKGRRFIVRPSWPLTVKTVWCAILLWLATWMPPACGTCKYW
jgi:hypothetical protein